MQAEPSTLPRTLVSQDCQNYGFMSVVQGPESCFTDSECQSEAELKSPTSDDAEVTGAQCGTDRDSKFSVRLPMSGCYVTRALKAKNTVASNWQVWHVTAATSSISCYFGQQQGVSLSMLSFTPRCLFRRTALSCDLSFDLNHSNLLITLTCLFHLLVQVPAVRICRP
jgi:hypothetical protein